MDRGLKFSLALHAVLLLLIIVGLPNWFVKEKVILAPVTIDVVNVAEKATAPKKALDRPKPPEKPKPAPKPSPKKPTPPKPAPQPEPKPKVEPAKVEKPKTPSKPEPKPELKPAPKPEPKPKPTPKVEPKPVEKKPDPKPAVKKEEKKQKTPETDLASILKDLRKEVEEKTPDEVDMKSKTKQSRLEHTAAEISDTVSADELSALRRQIAACWNIPAGAVDAGEMIIDVRVWANPDGTVRSAQLLDTARMARDPNFRTAAESALRAIQHPNCSPLKLPLHKYDQWKVFTFSFNPRDML